MNELFRKEYMEASDKLLEKGYYVDNMFYDSNCYEASDVNQVLIDHLSLAQLIALSEMLQMINYI